MTGTTATGLTVRRARPDETGALVALAGRALGWDDDPRHRELFEWKHRDNPFGPSPAWVADADGELVGFRTFLRWRWAAGGREVPAVRAVDTATHPDHQGRGVFSRLTRTALVALAEEGAAFVFNTPNAQSRPGYLKMGWRSLGRVGLAVRARPGAAARVLAARRPAEKWSEPTTAGVAAPDLLADHDAVARLLARRPADRRLRTAVTPAFLSWRYGLSSLAYRALPAGDRVEDGAVLFRLRRRGPALEATIADVLGVSGRRAGALVGEVLRASGADYAVAARATLPAAGVPLPGQGPHLTWRELVPQPPAHRRDLALCLGDVELF